VQVLDLNPTGDSTQIGIGRDAFLTAKGWGLQLSVEILPTMAPHHLP
jgi:hypothetical protein